MQEKILHDIKKQYQSLIEPDFSFVKIQAQKNIYEKIINEIEKKHSIENVTDFNEDVSLVYYIDNRFTIYISLVGDFVIMTEGRRFLEKEKIPEYLQRIFVTNKLHILDKATVEKNLRINLFNTVSDETRVFHALFSDIDIPWCI